ncbi:MAG TPA: phosphatase PAP2 family protein [Flavisolibacter sp.]|nr:phosphatase PAP2 family protein [Flavisolibacter sp.]
MRKYLKIIMLDIYNIRYPIVTANQPFVPLVHTITWFKFCIMEIKDINMRIKYGVLLMTTFLTVSLIHAQKVDTLIKKLDSLHLQKDSAAGKKINVNKTAYNENTKMTIPVYIALLGTDFTQEITGPFHTTGKSWGKVAAFAVIEGGLFFADKSIQSYATKLMDRNDKFRKVSHYVTNFGATYEGYTLAAFGLYGYIFKSEKVKTTTYLATQSYLVAGAMQFVLKYLSGEQRPNYNDPNHGSPAPIFHGPAFSFKQGGSTTGFPSGHTTAAFAAATVFAEEYRDQTLIPVIAYSAATLIGLSRITENAHWATDVFAGAALGYVTGLQVVRNYHRYAYMQNHKSPIRSMSFNVHYNYDHIEPALILSLR